MNAGKGFRKVLDRAFGPIARSAIRNTLIHPILSANYRVTIIGGEDALSCAEEGALVLSNHVSLLDGPFLTNVAWPYGRLRLCAWYREYYNPLQWPLMFIYGVVPVGSPTEAPKRWRPEIQGEERERLWKIERQRLKDESMNAMKKILRKEPGEKARFLGLFVEGGIGNGETVVVNEKLTGTHDLIEAYPDKPILLVKIEGLERSRAGKKRPAAPFWQRLPVTITIKRVDRVSREGGHRELNRRIAAFYNDGTPLAVDAHKAA